MKKTITYALAATFGFAVSSQAAVLVAGTTWGVDFAGPNGGGPIAPTNNFNEWVFGTTPTTVSTINDTSGVVIDNVEMTIAGATDGDANTPVIGGEPSVFDASNIEDWTIFGNPGDNTPGTITFTGLDDSLTYDLIIGNNWSADPGLTDTTYTVDGQALTNDADVPGDSFVSFTGLNTDGSGNLVIELTSPNNTFFRAVNALHITAVPEPSLQLF